MPKNIYIYIPPAPCFLKIPEKPVVNIFCILIVNLCFSFAFLNIGGRSNAWPTIEAAHKNASRK